MSKRAAPPKGDAVSLLAVLVVVGLVAVVVDLMLLDRALGRGDGSAWALFAIVSAAVIALAVLGATVWVRSSD